MHFLSKFGAETHNVVYGQTFNVSFGTSGSIPITIKKIWSI